MGNPKAFLTIHRQEAGYRPVHDRIDDFSEVEQTLNSSDRKRQASRCMDCGVPFCHWACPLGNRQPEWQDLLYKGRWREAFHVLQQTCDFPEFTGRICPALCEQSCVLKLSCDEPVTIRENEAAIVEAAFREGYIQPLHPVPNGKKVAIIGSGPAGLVAANRLNRAGYHTVVFERDERAGGLLRFGIPNFKLSKNIIDRRIRLMEAEGVEFRLNSHVGESCLPVSALQAEFDALCFAIGAEKPRDLVVEGRDLKGIHFALELLGQQNRQLEGIAVPEAERISCKGKRVLVIGGGDTGSDCVGTAIRQGAQSVTQIEIMPKPPVSCDPETYWLTHPHLLKTSSSHEEGCLRRWSLSTRRFIGKSEQLQAVEVETVEWTKADDGQWQMRPTGQVETLYVDLVLLAMGFLRPDIESLPRGEGLFTCGDAASGASLVVRAMASGCQVAEAINDYLQKK